MVRKIVKANFEAAIKLVQPQIMTLISLSCPPVRRPSTAVSVCHWHEVCFIIPSFTVRVGPAKPAKSKDHRICGLSNTRTVGPQSTNGAGS